MNGTIALSILSDNSRTFSKSSSVNDIIPKSFANTSFTLLSSNMPLLFISISFCTLLLRFKPNAFLALLITPLFRNELIAFVFLPVTLLSKSASIELISFAASSTVNPKSVIDFTIAALASFIFLALPITLFQSTAFVTFPLMVLSVANPASISFCLIISSFWLVVSNVSNMLS